MPEVILTYDISSRHTDVKDRLISQYSYSKTITGTVVGTNTPNTVVLPNTTVLHSNKTVQQAVEDIKAATAFFGVKLEKYAAIEVATSAQWLANDPA